MYKVSLWMSSSPTLTYIYNAHTLTRLTRTRTGWQLRYNTPPIYNYKKTCQKEKNIFFHQEVLTSSLIMVKTRRSLLKRTSWYSFTRDPTVRWSWLWIGDRQQRRKNSRWEIRKNEGKKIVPIITNVKERSVKIARRDRRGARTAGKLKYPSFAFV